MFFKELSCELECALSILGGINMQNRWKGIITDQIYNTLGAFLYAVGIVTFAKNAGFAPGGLSGLALLLNYLWNLPIGVMTLMLNIPLIVLCYRYVGKQFLFKTAISMVYCTVFVDLIFPYFSCYKGDQMLAAIFSGIFLGAGMSFMYMRGSSTGGTDFLIMAVKVLRPHLSIGGVTLAFDVIIITLGWAVYGSVDAVLYGLVSTSITSIVLDKILYGAGSGKLLMIITNYGQMIADAIAIECDRGSTLGEATGTYTGNRKEILLCACSRQDVYKIRAAAYRIDPDCMVMVTETNEVYGEGFLSHNKKTTFV